MKAQWAPSRMTNQRTQTATIVFAAAIALLGVSARGDESSKTLKLMGEVDGRAGYGSGMGMLGLPGQQIRVRLVSEATTSGVQVADSGQSASATVQEQYDWKAEGGRLLNVWGPGVTYQCPKKSGTYRVDATYSLSTTIKGAKDASETGSSNTDWSFVFFVQFPFNREGNGNIDGYPIGIYPNEEDPVVSAIVAGHREAYRPPKWFARVSKKERDVFISPHFRIGEFCSPYSENDPVFVAISPKLIDLLERLREHLIRPGRENPRLAILRAFLSPNEINQLKRKGVRLSEFTRHLYGDAASIIVDSDGDGVMDDLDGDGKADRRDVDYLSRVVEQIERETRRPGGLAIYSAPTDPLMPKTPYLTVDCRGWKARWGSTGGATKSEE